MSMNEETMKQGQANSALLAEYCPEVMQAFGAVHGKVIKEGALDKKAKELVALGIAIAVRCEGCIISHVKACLDLGVTMEELGEVVGVAIMMGGGPSSVYGAKALSYATDFLGK